MNTAGILRLKGWCPHTVYLGGGEENRTPVRRSVRTGVSGRSMSFDIPSPDAGIHASGPVASYFTWQGSKL